MVLNIFYLRIHDVSHLDAVSKPCVMPRTVSLGAGVTAQILLPERVPVMC